MEDLNVMTKMQASVSMAQNMAAIEGDGEAVKSTTQFYVHEGQLWSLAIAGPSRTREVDMDEDDWEHEEQYVFDEEGEAEDGGMHEIREHKQVKDVIGDEFKTEYVVSLDGTDNIMLFTGKTAQIEKGFVVSTKEDAGLQEIAKLPEPMTAPGVHPVTTNGTATDVLLCGGNDQKKCYNYNIQKDTWTCVGSLPKGHVQGHMMMLSYKERQVITLYSCPAGNYFKLEGATNVAVDGDMRYQGDAWKWLFRLDIPIKNFSIQSSFLHNDKLIVFSHGQPKNLNETFSSFLLIFDLVIHEGLISILNPHYTVVQLNNLVNCEPNSRPSLSQFGSDLVIRVPQIKGEDDEARKLVELTVPNGDFKESIGIKFIFLKFEV